MLAGMQLGDWRGDEEEVQVKEEEARAQEDSAAASRIVATPSPGQYHHHYIQYEPVQDPASVGQYICIYIMVGGSRNLPQWKFLPFQE